MRNRGLIIWVTLFIFLGGVLQAQQKNRAAIKTKVEAGRRQILPGEQVQLTVTATVPASQTLTRWVEVRDSLGLLEVLKRGEIDSTRQGDQVTYSQTFTLTAFDSGFWVVPPFTITAGRKSYKTDTLGISVMPVPLKGSSYNDIHEIIDVPPPAFNWRKWIPYALALVLTLALAFYFFTRKKPVPAPKPAFESKLTPFDQAMQELRKLRDEKVLESGEVKSYHARLYDILRIYLVRQFKWPVLQSTTDEVLIRLKEARLPGDPFSRVAASLRLSDAVKFARYLPPENASREAYSAVDEIIRVLQNPKT